MTLNTSVTASAKPWVFLRCLNPTDTPQVIPAKTSVTANTRLSFTEVLLTGITGPFSSLSQDVANIRYCFPSVNSKIFFNLMN
eukprot:m.299504 g.299504  ORF g.299504 m.299504 type:complete len:83 (+) comp40788_c1_seq22:1035-1283(+)